MRKRVFIATALAVALVCGCGDKQRRAAADSTAAPADSAAQDGSTLSGICGEGSAMNTLQLITDGGDSLTLSVKEARDRQRVYGGYACGDRMTVVRGKDGNTAELVVNETTLTGTWLMPPPLEGTPPVGVSLLAGGVAESEGQNATEYKSWRIVSGGRLELVSVREGGGAAEDTTTYDIMRLDGDSLIYAGGETLFKYGRKR